MSFDFNKLAENTRLKLLPNTIQQQIIQLLSAGNFIEAKALFELWCRRKHAHGN